MKLLKEDEWFLSRIVGDFACQVWDAQNLHILYIYMETEF